MKKIKIVFAVSAAVLLGTGCKKNLDLLPTDTFDESKAYVTVDDLQRGLNTVYGRFDGDNTIYINATISDEVKFGPDNAGQGQFEYRLQYNADNTTSGSTTSGWFSNYSMINQANRVLDAIPTVPSVAANDDARKNIIRGQALALRAYGYLELIQRYAKRYNASDPFGVPVVLKNELLGAPARNTTGEVVTQIEKDLNDAKALLTAPTAATFDDKFINQISVVALQARVALYKGDWAAARDNATTVINSAVRPLTSGTDYANIWTDASTSEVLLRFRRTGQSVGANFTTTGGQVYFSPSDKFVAQFPSSADVRRNVCIITAGGKRNINKHFTSAAGPRINDVKAIRIAEMYLIRAEALAELDGAANFTAATADLNLLRTNRITGYVNQTFADKAALISAIMIERYKELAFEGFRLFDLKRKGLDVNRNASDVDSPNWQNLLSSNFRMTFPIPPAELQGNRNMVQNPGY
jgi:starch-binding outer membrane protein, SusD/RagB family